jgi:broad specificity phosphatase PhoE
MNPKTLLTFVRHGHVHNPQGVLYGRLPRFHLSERGEEQARWIALVLAEEQIAAVASSPMLRARQTGQAILTCHPGMPLATSRHLNEVLTPYQGVAEAEADLRDGDFYTGCGPGFEQPADVLARMRRFASRIVRQHPGQQVVAVTHGDPIAFFVLWAGGARVTPRNKARLTPLGVAGGYPAPASATTYAFTTDPDAPPRLVRHLSP